MSSLLRFSILGVVQGLTEFLPVSSSGHLAVLSKVFGLSEVSVELALLLHLATLCAVFLYLRKEILYALKTPRLILIIFLATIPTSAIGLLLSGTVKNIFQNNPNAVFIFLFLTGILIHFAARARNIDVKGFEQISYLKAFIIGLAQGIAVIPGISRSGATISAGIFSGIDAKTAAKFSFLLSIPAIAGAALVELKDFQTSALLQYPIWQIFSGMFFAFVSALASLWLLIKTIEKRNFRYFAYYLWVLAVVGIFVGV